MFQSFDSKINPAVAQHPMRQLRIEMKRQGLDGFLVPCHDEYQIESTPLSSQRLLWLTGFTGSAGCALILQDQAILFIDGRYQLQVRQQTDPDLFSYENLIETPPHLWLLSYLTTTKADQKPKVIGFDPWLHTMDDARKLRQSLNLSGNHLYPVARNPIDLLWADRPPPLMNPVIMHPDHYTGKPATEKLTSLKQTIQTSGSAGLVLTDPTSIAWCLNIRGSDLETLPVALAFAIIKAEGKPELFIDMHKIDPVKDHALTALCDIFPFADFTNRLTILVQDGQQCLLDPMSTPEQVRLIVEQAGGKILETTNPVLLSRAIKTVTECAGARQAHLRDGIALVRFFSWLEAQSKLSPSSLNEMAAAQKLEQFRVITAQEMGSELKCLAFPTISGVGAHGAIIHYHVQEDSNHIFQNGMLYLVDSGGQYHDGTTDVTRTIAIGSQGQWEKQCFTLVLKGMITLSAARFPPGTRGQDLDALARIALWKQGLDYAHGTGHGVGSFLAVHEGPQALSRYNQQKLQAGMILSNEPGYYQENAFGIRIENLMLVQEATIPEGGKLAMHQFETLTLCPIDKTLILPHLLTVEERSWLNHYHETVYHKLMPYLQDPETRSWLFSATRPL